MAHKPRSADTSPVRPATARPSPALSGHVRVPGDKSISHRAVMFAGLAQGTTTISGLLEGEDVQATLAAMRALGAVAARQPGSSGDGDTVWRVTGFGGAEGAHDPEDVLDMGNSGTSARLLMGVIAGLGRTACLTGDASLRKRPMARVIEPLSRMGARVIARSGGRLPLAQSAPPRLQAIDYPLPVPSAQVKSAVLLAGLGAEGTTTVTEPERTRDHTERMLAAFGVQVTSHAPHGDEGPRHLSISGGQRLRAPQAPVVVPGDPSSAAFPIVAAAIVPGSDVTVTGVGLNPTRIGLLTTLREMGADIQMLAPRTVGGEPVADLRVRHQPLRGVTVPAARVPSMVDEFPALFVAAACASGVSRMTGLAELRVKESDRLILMANGLAAAGVALEVLLEDGAEAMTIRGTGAPPAGGCTVRTALDHRIAMAFLTLGLATTEGITVDDITPVATSFPTFVPLMQSLGALLTDGD